MQAIAMIKTSLVVMAAAALVATPASSAERVGFVEGWQIVRDITPERRVCLMIADLNDGSALVFAQSTARPKQVIVTIANASWSSLNLGHSYPLVVEISHRRNTVAANVVPVPSGMGLTFSISDDQYHNIFFNSAGYIEVKIGERKLMAYAKVRGDIDAVYRIGECFRGLSDPFEK